MKMLSVLLSGGLLLISACATAGTRGPSPLGLALTQAGYISAPVECDDATCKQSWERAQLWIVKHSKWKIQTATDVLVQTFNQSQYDPSYAFVVTKEPLGSGKYRIGMSLSCGNLFGCSSSPYEVQSAFYTYVKTGNDVLSGVGRVGGLLY